MKAVEHKIMLTDALDKIDNEIFEDELTADEDEYIVLRHPMTIPSKYLFRDREEAALVASLPEDDPKVVAENEKRTFLTTMWSIADWNIRNAEGEPAEKISVKDGKFDGWYSLGTDQQILIQLLMTEQFKRKDKDETPKIVVDEDNPLPVAS